MNLATKYPLGNKTPVYKLSQRLLPSIRGFFILALTLWMILPVVAQSDKDCFPAKPNRLVNDYVNALKPNEIAALEDKLVSFDKQHSTQIAVVFLKDICGYDAAQYSYTLAEQWGIGQKGKNNGILIMVVPFGDTGQRTTFIATGYGLEGAVPDAIAKRIVENEMIPYFRQGDFYTGIHSATDVLISLTSGEFTADEYAEDNAAGALFGAILVFLIMAIILISRMTSVRKYASRNDLSFWAAMAIMNAAASSRKGSYSNFSGGSFGSGGGFGGFGGGSFGGGGAGGSW